MQTKESQVHRAYSFITGFHVISGYTHSFDGLMCYQMYPEPPLRAWTFYANAVDRVWRVGSYYCYQPARRRHFTWPWRLIAVLWLHRSLVRLGTSMIQLKIDASVSCFGR